jgi:hypothetical protein
VSTSSATPTSPKEANYDGTREFEGVTDSGGYGEEKPIQPVATPANVHENSLKVTFFKGFGFLDPTIFFFSFFNQIESY